MYINCIAVESSNIIEKVIFRCSDLWTSFINYKKNIYNFEQGFLVIVLIFISAYIITWPIWLDLRWWGVLNRTLCDKVCQWLATGQWFSLGTMVSFINNTNIVESGVKHHKPNLSQANLIRFVVQNRSIHKKVLLPLRLTVSPIIYPRIPHFIVNFTILNCFVL